MHAFGFLATGSKHVAAGGERRNAGGMHDLRDGVSHLSPTETVAGPLDEHRCRGARMTEVPEVHDGPPHAEGTPDAAFDGAGLPVEHSRAWSKRQDWTMFELWVRKAE